MRKLLVLFFVVASSAILADEIDVSTYNQAINIVVEKQGEWFSSQKTNWTHNIDSHSFSVTRPFAPGIVDSTKMFVVEYSVNGEIKAAKDAVQLLVALCFKKLGTQ